MQGDLASISKHMCAHTHTHSHACTHRYRIFARSQIVCADLMALPSHVHTTERGFVFLTAPNSKAKDQSLYHFSSPGSTIPASRTFLGLTVLHCTYKYFLITCNVDHPFPNFFLLQTLKIQRRK